MLSNAATAANSSKRWDPYLRSRIDCGDVTAAIFLGLTSNKISAQTFPGSEFEGAAADWGGVAAVSAGAGTFVAPSTGIHGWFWENQSLEPVTIKLVSSGFYDYIMQNLNDVKTRLQPADPK
jgi:hypothetical protein